MSLPAPYYEDDSVMLFVGDSMQIVPRFVAQYGRPDHVITDVPYSERTHVAAKTCKPGQRLIEDTDFVSTGSDWVRSLIGTCRPKRWVVMSCDYQHAFELERDPPSGLEAVRLGVWAKSGGYAPQFSGDRPAQGWEAVSILHTPGRKKWNGGGRAAVWRDASERNAQVPTQKPLSLVRSFVTLFTDPGDLILDPCAGSGTTGRACKDLGRRAVLIELSAAHADVAVLRLRQEALPFAPLVPQEQLSLVPEQEKETEQ